MNEPSANACYSCGYSLKGLAVADGLFKCPECGSLQTISYTTAPRAGALDLFRKYPLVWLSPLATGVVVIGAQWLVPDTLFSFIVMIAVLLWNVFLPALYFLISIVTIAFRVPGRLQRIVFFLAWLAVGFASIVGVGTVMNALGR